MTRGPDMAEPREPPPVDVSYVVPIYNEEACLPQLVAALEELLERLRPRYAVEFVLVDDGSRDASWRLIEQAAARLPQVAGVRLSRNFGHQVALTCGYRMARGRAVISMDADLQDPPEVTLEMLEAWEAGADVVYAARTARPGESWFKRATAKLFYVLLERLGAPDVPRDCADFRLLSRRALDALNRLPERHRYVRGLVGWIGLSTVTLTYERRPRAAGTTKYPLWRMLRLATDAIVSMSFNPLRTAYVLAVLVALPFLAYLGYNLALWLVYDVEMERGWPSLILSVILFGTSILLFMGLLGEYVGRIYEEVKRRPLYLVRGKTGAGAPPEDDA